MIKMSKTKVYTAVANILIIIIVHYGMIAFNLYNDVKSRIYDDFVEFGNSLENLNDNISKILVIGNKSLGEEKYFVDVNEIRNFTRSGRIAYNLEKESFFHDYTFMYVDVDNVIKEILSDEAVTVSEEKYLETLYDYNDELITEFKNILGDSYDYNKYNSKKQQNVEKEIIKIYSRYSKMADKLLESKKYRFLKDYKGDFTKEYLEEDFKKVKIYCEEVFSKIIDNGYLKYDNTNEKNSQTYKFSTHLEEEDFNLPIDNEVQYEIEYNKKTNIVSLDAVSYIIGSKDKKYTEDDLDDTADNIVSRFNNRLTVFNKKVSYDSEEKGKIDSIAYSYIEKIDDIYDETKKIDIIINSNGIITRFEIMYPSHENINSPIIAKEEVLNRLDEKAKVTDIVKIRNIEGKIEYEVHFKYENVLYSAVFDGYDGKIKYYGRDIRNYSNIN